MIYRASFHSPLGLLRLYRRQDHFVYLAFPNDDEGRVRRMWPEAAIVDEGILPEPYYSDLVQYFRGHPLQIDWPVVLQGTEFQQKVWQQLSLIPYGHTTTYKEIGDQIGCRGYRAIGQAVGANPLPIILPCHRVIGSHGLGGFSGGLSIKKFLLELEKSLADLSDFC